MRRTGGFSQLPLWLACLAWGLVAIGGAEAQAATESVLLSFGDFPNGANPYAALTRDAAGNLYGTTNQGGAADVGVVFKLTPSGTMKILHSFRSGTDGANPYAGVTLDSGYLYGTTYGGGSANAGVVYKVDSTGHETVLYSFTGGADGANPYSGVVLDSAGNLYGTTYNGGASKAGVVYRVSSSGQETVLYTFTGGTDGGNPYAGVIFDSSGNLYGTAFHGGSAGYYAAGVVYKLSPSGQETVLYSFSFSSTEACYPYGGVILDPAGNLYGTASSGGEWYGGAVFKLDKLGNYTVLFNLALLDGPAKPEGGLVMDAAGNLYGTTQQSKNGLGPGAVFKLDTAGNLKSLYSFPGASNSQSFPSGPSGGLVLDSSGNLYGATSYGGVSGMIYKFAPSGQETTLYSFAGAPGGTRPGTITRDPVGNIYGVTGGAARPTSAWCTSLTLPGMKRCSTPSLAVPMERTHPMVRYATRRATFTARPRLAARRRAGQGSAWYINWTRPASRPCCTRSRAGQMAATHMG